MILLLICVAVLLVVAVLYFQQYRSTFNKYEIKYLPTVPLLGPLYNMIAPKEHLGPRLLHLYKSFPGERYVGSYEFMTAHLVVRDIELLKKIGIKDFEYFVDHSNMGPDESLFGRSLFFLRGQEWKDMRYLLTPAFTSSKIRLMVPFMVEVGDQMMRLLKKKMKDSKDGYIDIDCKDLTTRYANDVIASCAFGVKVDSHNDEDNQFYKMGKKITESTISILRMLVFMLFVYVPPLLKLLDSKLIPHVAQNFFKHIVLDTMKEREMKKIIRPDMIHLLMEAKKGQLSHEDVKTSDEAAGFATAEVSLLGKKKINNRVWADNDLVSQAFLFFAAGFESVSSSMCFILHELAVNPDVQERLVQEIKEHDAKNGGKFDFNSIQSMAYLDMVVSEGLRMWPPFVVNDRECSKDYNIGKPNDAAKKDYIIPKGTMVVIPTYAFHHNPKYYPNPEKFDPERFSEENKHKINPFSYMPFGIGPRNCIGSRFALCEIKVIIYQILLHMELSPCEKTCVPAQLVPNTFNIHLKGGHWLRFRPRD